MVVLVNGAWPMRQGWPRRWIWLVRNCRANYRAKHRRLKQLRSPSRPVVVESTGVVVGKGKRKSKSRRLEEFLKKVCLIQVELIENSSGLKYLYAAGGVFISKHGLIATCDHCFQDPGKTFVSVQIRRHGNKEQFIKPNILFRYPHLDLAILNIQTSAKVRHAKLHRTLNVDWGQRVVSVSHSQTRFSISRGLIAYPFPKNTELPELKPDGHRVEALNEGEQPLPRYLHCTPAGAIHQPDVPVVMVHGASTGHGASGNPIFNEKNKKFIGIQVAGGQGLCYSLPSTIIWKVLKDEVEKASSSAEDGTSTSCGFLKALCGMEWRPCISECGVSTGFFGSFPFSVVLKRTLRRVHFC